MTAVPSKSVIGVRGRRLTFLSCSLLVAAVAGVFAVKVFLVRAPAGRSGGMNHQFVVANGCEVADLTGVHEGYSVRPADGYVAFTINVSAPNIPATFLRLSALPQEPVFLTVEVGTHRDVEATLRKTPADPFHTDVYYLDGLSHDAARGVFRSYERLLTHDGGVKFGVGSHATRHDEVFVDGYKVFAVYTVEPEKYRAALTTLGLREEPAIKTVWQTFTRESPGKRRVLSGGGKTIWEMVKELKGRGMYLAERRED